MLKKQIQQNKQTKQKNQQQLKRSLSWDFMVKDIVRPPRAIYQNYQLGDSTFTTKGKSYQRQDIKVTHNTKILQLTIYHSRCQKTYTIPFIILYMHGNSSSKLQATSLLKTLPQGIALASFDFMGCGKNQQADIITLGYRQSQQCKTISEYLKSRQFKVILWGRSMGAVTALLNGQAQFIVADSSFKSFKSLCKQVAKSNSPVIPNFMVTCIFPCVFTKLRWDIDKYAQYNVDNLDVFQAVKNLNTSTVVIFLSGNNDRLINKRNSQKLHEVCPCKQKYIKIFQGDHNTPRPQQILKQVMDIILNYVQKKQTNHPIKCSNTSNTQTSIT